MRMTEKIVPFPMADMPVTEDSLAVRFVDEHEDNLLFDHHSGRWFIWDGQRWKKNETKLPINWVRELCRNIAARDPSIAKALGKAGVVKGVEQLARVDPRVACTSEIFDGDTMLLGTPGGTIDLRTGEIRNADQGDYITKSTSTAPERRGAKPVRFLAFLDDATGGDQTLVDYLQQVAGYCLTGKTTEHALFFIYGPGGNGKSVFLNVLRGILGDYAVSAPIESFMASRTPQHSTDVAMMKGARLVTASETDSGRQWAEAKVKQLTGGDNVTARFMRQDNFEYRPQFKLLIIGNHKPQLRSVDEANKRRFRLLPFIITPDNPNPNLEDELRKEWPKILNWMIEGCLKWQHHGLLSPDKVAKATTEYFEDQDTLSQWLDECCEVNNRELIETGCISAMQSCPSSKLFSDWKNWCDRNGETPGSNKAFSEQLSRLGFIKVRSKKGMVFYGLRLEVEAQENRYV
jgi:putative DNA primase/helicase